MMQPTKCPVCLGAYGISSKVQDMAINCVFIVNCAACGNYQISEEAWHDELKTDSRYASEWNAAKRASLSHAIVTRKEVSIGNNSTPQLNNGWVRSFRLAPLALPLPPEQTRNTIRLIGNHFKETGEPIKQLHDGMYVTIGTINPNIAGTLILELVKTKIISSLLVDGGLAGFQEVYLSLDGWKMWEDIQSGNTETKVGMIAMQFGDATLDDFVNKTVKPAVSSIDGYSLIRVDDSPRAGIIDMIMRQTIQESAFVLADLTHGNNGAYWEAGYAEGLGKPVIYLCEKAIFDKEKTHFDTNHCTTIIWDESKPKEFSKQLVAAIKNSLNIIN